jgi:FkbM family methyltransferase
MLHRAILMDHEYVRRAMKSPARRADAALWLRIRAHIGAAVFRMPMVPTSDSPNLWIAGLLNPGDTYFDVGANAGETLSVAVARLGAAGHAHAFEPNPITFASLSSLVQLTGWRNVRLVPAALGAEKGEATLFCPPSSGSATISRTFISHIPDGSVSSVLCPVITLDSYWEQAGRCAVTLMKMDIEGAELPALRGASKFIDEARPYIVLEITGSESREAAFGYRTEELLSFLTDRNFDLFHMEGGRVYQLKEFGNLRESIHDVCAIPREKRERKEVRELLAARKPR